MVEAQVDNFGPVDLAIFILMLSISVAVGIYFAFADRKEKNVDNYYFGGRNMSPVPVGLSISVTFISAITIIGFPAETYFYGTIMFWFGWAITVPYCIACLYYIPLINRLRLTSIYEYLEMRFHKSLRKGASVIAVITMVLYMGMTIYVPGLALNAVTPLSLPWTIALTSAICTFYTTLGGMKAVIWTDVLQTLTMAAGALSGLIKSVILVGGFEKIWPAAERGGRINTWNFNPDPTIRYTIWTFIIGHGIGSCRMTCINQSICQRYLSCGSTRTARIAGMISLVPTMILSSVAVLTGAAMYTYYEGCDPLSSHKISKPDQMMPYMILEIFQDTPGMAGLFVAAGFSGTLSTVSSGINALAGLILEDFILPRKPKLSQGAKMTISKAMVFAFGVLVMCVAFVVSQLDATIMRVAFTISGAIEGPLLGLFTLGIFFPWTTSLGAGIGQVVGTIFSCWIAVGSLLYGKAANIKLPVSTDQCPVPTSVISMENGTYFPTTRSMLMMDNATSASSEGGFDWMTSPFQSMTDYMETETVTDAESPSGLSLQTTLYALSYFYYAVLSLIVTIIVGLIVSFLTGAKKPSEADPMLFVPFIDNKILPEKVRKFFRFGVRDLPEETSGKETYRSIDENKPMLVFDGRESVV